MFASDRKLIVRKKKKLKNISRVGVISPIGPHFHADGTCGLHYYMRRTDANLNLIEIKKETQPCSRIYYSNVS
jgi:hypothetical protein